MQIHSGHATRQQAIVDLFTSTFAASEGEAEGALIGQLTRNLIQTTLDADLIVWSACDGDTLLGCTIWSRLAFAQDDRTVFVLSPVAVRTQNQKAGIGQELITAGLDDLRQKGVDYAVTYGDPDYYVKTGFTPISEDFVQAPLALSYPHGWLGQPLSDRASQPFRGASRCVPALNKSEYW